MLNVAADICQLVQNIGSMEDIGVKVASARESAIAQCTVKEASSALYNVIVKSAAEYVDPQPTHHQRVVAFVDKMASLLGRPVIPAETQLKIASIVATDDALDLVRQGTADAAEQEKFAAAQAFGREFLVSILREVF